MEEQQFHMPLLCVDFTEVCTTEFVAASGQKRETAWLCF